VDDILIQPRNLLISFDGPICSLFTDMAASRVTNSLRQVIAQESARVPETIEHTGNWIEILSYAASVSPDLAARVESELTTIESAAITTATPTPYLHDVLTACRDSARPVAIISNHSAIAVHAYLALHDLDGQIRFVAARISPDATVLMPRPELVVIAVTGLDTQSSDCALVGGSVTDIQAAHAAEAHSIAYARTSRDTDDLADAGAGAIITSMADLALRLRAHPSGCKL